MFPSAPPGYEGNPRPPRGFPEAKIGQVSPKPTLVYNPWMTLYILFFDANQRLVIVVDGGKSRFQGTSQQEVLRQYPQLKETYRDSDKYEMQVEAQPCVTLMLLISVKDNTVGPIAYVFTCPTILGAHTAQSPAQTAPPAGMGERIPNEGYSHVPVGTTIEYQNHPPASGTHYPTPAATGVYPRGLAPGFWVHSLEHGYVVLVYKSPVSEALLEQFNQMVTDFPKSKYGNVKLVIAPYDEMTYPFAVVAWDWRLWMDTFDRAVVLEFYKAHVDHGPEDIP
jgi:hypothetical protein